MIIYRFYAPWCGHCQSLKPVYEKAAKALDGLAKVAAVNCDAEENKPFCGTMGVKGFPTLKIVRPGKKPGRPFVEDYQGARTAVAIVDAVKDKINNHVKRLTDNIVDEWLEADAEKPKVILFTDKGTTSALIKSLAIDFLGSVSVGQIRDKEKKTSQKFDVTSYPSIVLVPGKGKEAIQYSGDMKKTAILKFLSEVAKPNPDPAPKKSIKPVSTNKSAASNASSKLSKVSVSHRSKDASSSLTQTSESIIDPLTPSPNPIVSDVPEGQTPISLDAVTTTLSSSLPSLTSVAEVKKTCLNSKSPTCVLIFTSSSQEGKTDDDSTTLAQSVLADIHHRYSQRGTKLFGIYIVPTTSSSGDEMSILRSTLLGSKSTTKLVSLNGKRSWLKRFDGDIFQKEEIVAWIDNLRMGEGRKEDIPSSLLLSDNVEEKDETPIIMDVSSSSSPSVTPSSDESTKSTSSETSDDIREKETAHSIEEEKPIEESTAVVTDQIPLTDMEEKEAEPTPSPTPSLSEVRVVSNNEKKERENHKLGVEHEEL